MSSNTIKKAQRMSHIAPFYVMDILAQADQLENQGQSIIHMEVGEPDFGTPQAVIRAAHEALDQGRTFYTPACGIPELRLAISKFYQQKFNCTVPAQRIIITPGASGALLLALSLLVDPGDKVLMSDPGYPCNRNFVHLLNGECIDVPVTADTQFQINSDILDEFLRDEIKVLMLASPSNPCGTIVEEAELKNLLHIAQDNNTHLIIDEIYQGLLYDDEPRCALKHSDSIFVVNSFSKYFGMTGWRLGWLVVPEDFIEDADKIAQNIFLSAPSIAQYAALAAFEEATLLELESRKEEFQRRRDYLIPMMKKMGFEIAAHPQGAFYLYLKCSMFTDDSYQFCKALLSKAGVAFAPGIDFGRYRAGQHLRVAYTTSMQNIRVGVNRLEAYLRSL